MVVRKECIFQETLQAQQGQNPLIPPPPPCGISPILQPLALPVLIVFASFSIQSDRMVPELDTIVPLESTKAYNMVDIIHSVSVTLAGLVCASSATSVVPVLWHREEVRNPQALTLDNRAECGVGTGQGPLSSVF